MDEHITDNTIKRLLRPRNEWGNKGDFGTLAMLCGSPYMSGAAYLSAISALKSGVGLLKFAGSDEVIAIMRQMLPEPVYTPVPGGDIFRRATAFLCGCGVGGYYEDILAGTLAACDVPAVLDADCINFLARNTFILREMKCERIITPHPGEMARLTGKSIAEIELSRSETAAEFAREYGCHVLLKGHRTVIAAPDGQVFINETGSSALAKGGSGDVLAGVIASLAAQGYSLLESARIGAHIHGLAGEILAVQEGECGVLPHELPGVIGRLLR